MDMLCKGVGRCFVVGGPRDVREGCMFIVSVRAQKQKNLTNIHKATLKLVAMLTLLKNEFFEFHFMTS